MRDLEKEISLETLKYRRKYGKQGKVLIVGEEEWQMLHDEEEPALGDDLGYESDGYVGTLFSLQVYRSCEESQLVVAGRE